MVGNNKLFFKACRKLGSFQDARITNKGAPDLNEFQSTVIFSMNYLQLSR